MLPENWFALAHRKTEAAMNNIDKEYACILP